MTQAADYLFDEIQERSRPLKRRIMRLLHIATDRTFSLVHFGHSDRIPEYAILSHTWGPATEEPTFDDLLHGVASSKRGYGKLRFCANQAYEDGLSYFWADTCCIDKTNSEELTTAINSMFRWYSRSSRCYVYLTDVAARSQDRRFDLDWPSALRSSRWFRRGWTLQELIAPKYVDFYTRDHVRIGDKHSLEQMIVHATGITPRALQGVALDSFDVDEKFAWAAKRETSREEDMAYCLLGIFGVFMPLIYGEGIASAHRRLRKEVV